MIIDGCLRRRERRRFMLHYAMLRVAAAIFMPRYAIS